MNSQTYKDHLLLFIQPSDKEPIGCGYYYIVTYGAQAHTAFRTRKALKKWMFDRGLKIGTRRNWLRRSVSIVGGYTNVCVMDNTADFTKTYGHLRLIPHLENGSYSIGYVDDITHTIYFQNPNTDRIIFDHQATEKQLQTL